MNVYNPPRVEKFLINAEDLIRKDGKEYRLISRSELGVRVEEIDRPGPALFFEYGPFSRWLDQGRAEVVRNHFLAEKPAPALTNTTTRLLSLLADDVLQQANNRLCWVTAALEELTKADDRAKPGQRPKFTRASLLLAMPAIKARVHAAVDEEETRYKRAYASGTVEYPRSPSVKSLYRWCKQYLEGGFPALCDARHLRGNRKPRMQREALALMHDVVRGYMNPQKPPKSKIIDDVGRAFRKANIERRLDGRPELDPPSRQTIRNAINRLSPFQCDLERLGFEKAMRKWSPQARGIEVDRPLQRVEMDEWKIDLSTEMAMAGLDPLFSEEERAELGLDGSKDRWWISVAIDCRTRYILAMRLTRRPSEACAIATVDMITRDKGEWADAAGAATSWWFHGTPEHIVVDSGGPYRGERLEAMLADLRISFERAPAGVPMLRGTIERVFQTIALRLLPYLSGRTFSDTVKRDDHPSEERAALKADELAYILVRYIVDIYHNTVHESLGCTPLEALEQTYGMFGAPPKPGAALRRAAFGTRLSRVIDKGGITVLGVRYSNPELQNWRKDNPKKKAELRWYNGDIGAIEVKLGRKWVTVPSVFGRFKEMTAQKWMAGLRAQRIQNAATIARNEATIIEAIDAIEAINAAAMKRANVFDFDWTAHRVRWAEESLLTNLTVAQQAEAPQLDPSDAEDRLLSSPIPVALGAPLDPAADRAPEPTAGPASVAEDDTADGEESDDDDTNTNTDHGWSF